MREVFLSEVESHRLEGAAVATLALVGVVAKAPVRVMSGLGSAFTESLRIFCIARSLRHSEKSLAVSRLHITFFNILQQETLTFEKAATCTSSCLCLVVGWLPLAASNLP